MYCIVDSTTTPYFNLAAEEFLLKNKDFPIFRLWRNAPSIIVGCNQNTYAEINRDYVISNNIPVVRRLSGGGAVFHDLGNINFTFIDKQIGGESSSEMFARFTQPIISALNELGVKAYLEGRNDLLIDGKKFSGNAICVHKGRVLQHGTLLFSASIENLSAALQTRPEKFIGKAVKSNISRVTNISRHLPKDNSLLGSGQGSTAASAEAFMTYLKEHIAKSYKIYQYTEQDLEAIQNLCDTKYSQDSWNYGNSPKYTFSNSKKFECGFIELHLNITKSTIQDCKIMGDFFSLCNIAELETTLIGLPYNTKAIDAALRKLDLNAYFSKLAIEEFLELCF